MDAENASRSCLKSVYLETDRTESLYSPFSDNYHFEKETDEESTLLDDQLSTHRTTMTIDNTATIHQVSLEDDENYLMEEKLWTSLNRELRDSGYQPVQFKSLSEAVGQHGSTICLDGNQSAELRGMLASLLNRANVRNHEIQQVVQLNKQLKDDLESSMAANELLKVKTCKLKALLAATEEYVSVRDTHKSSNMQKLNRWCSTSSSFNQFDGNVDTSNCQTNWHSLCNKLEDVINSVEHNRCQKLECRDQHNEIFAFICAQLKNLRRDLGFATEHFNQLEKTVQLLDSQRNHLMEKLNHLEYGEKCSKSSFIDANSLTTSQCRSLINDCCEHLELRDAFRLPAEVARLQTGKVLRNQVIDLLKSVDAPVFSEKIYDLDLRIIANLKFWLDQLRALPQLSELINRFSQVAFPWRAPIHLNERCDLWQVAKALESLLRVAEHQFDDCARHLEKAPLTTLATLVKQFQSILDPSTSNADPRVEDICKNISESRTTLTMLRSLAGLPSGAFVTALSDTILRTPCQLQSAYWNAEDLKPLLHRMQQYDEFFPVFHSLIEQLKEDLNVSRVDAILPTVRAMKSELNLRSY